MEPDGGQSTSPGTDKARVFLALWPDARVRAGLHQAAVDGARRFGGRAMQAQTLHLTLAFIGDVALEQVPVLQAAGAGVRNGAFSLALDRLGFWGHNRILWAGSRRDEPGLTALAHDLAARLQAVGYSSGIRTGQAFAPHVTLVRKVTEARPRLWDLPVLEWACDSFVLVRSRLSSSGASYEILEEWSLG